MKIFPEDFRKRAVFFYRARYLVTIYTPKEAHSRIFVIGGAFFAQQEVAKKIMSYSKASLYNTQVTIL